jgi:4-amino-4-deoxy-L-arabinose transferase-like glycosyltransferase
MNHARLLAAGRIHVQPRTLAGLPQAGLPTFLYVPLGFKPAWNGDGIVPTYPTGLALFVLALKPLAGWTHAGDAVIVLHSIAGLLATYLLCRMAGLGRRWAAVGAAVIGLSPLYLFMSLQAMSDVPSLVWTTLAVMAAWKSRERAPWALAAGAAMALDVLLRPTNVLAFIPVGIALGASPRRWIHLIIGGLPGAVFFGAHSVAAYGSFATTGYGDNSLAFLARYVPATLLHYARWLPALFTPLAALALGLPWIGAAGARTRWILGTWVLAYAAFYSSYEYTHESWWYLRFLLPAAPALVAASLLVLRALLSRAPGWIDPGRSLPALAALLALVASCCAWETHSLSALSVGADEQRYGRLADWLQRSVPPDSVILAMQASGALFYYTKFTIIRWDTLDQANVGRVETAIRASKRPLYAVLFPFEAAESRVLETRMPGHWSQVGSVNDVTIWRRDFDAAKP